MVYWDNAPWEPRKWQREALPVIINAIKSGVKAPVVSAIMGAGKSITISELVYQALKNLKPDHKILICAPKIDLVNQLGGTVSYRCGKENVGKFFSEEKDITKKVIVTTFVSSNKLSRLLKEQGQKIAMIIGDEIHGTETDDFKEAFERFNPACAIGFTATPYRSNKKETLSLWQEVVYRYSAKDALEDKVIVPWELVHWDGKGTDEIDQVCLNMIKKMISLTGGAGIVNALNIQDAHDYAGFLDENGVSAGVIHSEMDKKWKEDTLRFLKEGKYQCVVHVSMLTEGVDIPFLKWIVLRRPVGAKVRFVQEVGRVLRAHPGKTRALVGDPYDLFGRFCLANPEQLGEALTAEEEEYEETLVDLEPDPQKRDVIRKMPPAVAFDHIDSYVMSILSILRSSNICPPPSEWEQLSWRGTSPTKKQRETIEKMKNFSRYMPKEVREPFKSIMHNVHRYNRGTAADILSVLFGLAKGSEQARKSPEPWKKHWKMPKLDWPEPSFPIQQLLFALERN